MIWCDALGEMMLLIAGCAFWAHYTNDRHYRGSMRLSYSLPQFSDRRSSKYRFPTKFLTNQRAGIGLETKLYIFYNNAYNYKSVATPWTL